MSELKEFESARIYWAVEQVERVAGDIDELHLDDNSFYLKSEADQVIAKLKAANERLRVFRDELVKDCKWLPTTITPDKNGFETMVQCTNGKKRVASFRMFDFHWYDVNNGNKLNVVKWLWQPSIPSDEKKEKT